jgi:transcriptional regulator with XRE-family HTH domain
MTQKMKKDFSTIIKEEREILGITQEEMSNKIGVSGRTIARWEAGESVPPDSKQKQIEEFLVLLKKAKNSGVSLASIASPAGLLFGTLLGSGVMAGAVAASMLKKEPKFSINVDENSEKIIENIKNVRLELYEINDKIQKITKLLNDIEDIL